MQSKICVSEAIASFYRSLLSTAKTTASVLGLKCLLVLAVESKVFNVLHKSDLWQDINEAILHFCYLFLQNSALFGLYMHKYSKLNLNTFARSLLQHSIGGTFGECALTCRCAAAASAWKYSGRVLNTHTIYSPKVPIFAEKSSKITSYLVKGQFYAKHRNTVRAEI